MTVATLTPEAKQLLSTTIRALRERLLRDVQDEAERRYHLSLPLSQAGLDEAHKRRRQRLDAWADERVRAVKTKSEKDKKAARERLLGQAVKEAGATLINRLVLIRHLEALGLSKPQVVTGGWASKGYQEFRDFAPGLLDDETEGYATLLQMVFDDLAVDLPGLFGEVGLTKLFPIPPATLREVVTKLDAKELESAWTDDTTLGWVYQYWNDPEREALDAKINEGGKIEPHEIASKTQMFTERYMVEWLLQNSLGLTWLCICKKNGWTPDAERVLPVLDARRADWRKKRNAGEVTLDALMPIEGELEDAWKYYVPQPIPEDAVEKAPDSIRTVKLLDPACGSGHFLVSAFGLFGTFYIEESRHRNETWSSEEIAESILANNLHGVDIDPRAIQIAAAALYLKAKTLAPKARPSRINLVAPTLQLGNLPDDDPSLVQLRSELKREAGIPEELTKRLVTALAGVDHLGTLLKVDDEVMAALKASDLEIERGLLGQGDLFKGFAKQQVTLTAGEAKVTLLDKLEQFLGRHSASEDLGLRLDGEQLAGGVRFVRMTKERQYDVVVGNPPYQGLSKTAFSDYIARKYPRGKADLYAAFLERSIELAREGGLSALLTMRGWMSLGQFAALRQAILRKCDIRSIADIGSGAFSSRSDSDLVTTAMLIVRNGNGEVPAVALQLSPLSDLTWDAGKPARRRASLWCQQDRYEFDQRGFRVIEGEPIVYWWSKEFLERYAGAPKLGKQCVVRAGGQTGNNVRFLRSWFEVQTRRIGLVEAGQIPPVESRWIPYVKGAEGLAWYEPLREIALWNPRFMEVLLAPGSHCSVFGYFFKKGVAFTSTGSAFKARKHRFASAFDVKGQSAFPESPDELCAVMNADVVRQVLSSLNPTVSFQPGDAKRMPVFPIQSVNAIFTVLNKCIDAHESQRESSVEFRKPGSSPWRYAQDWAQRAVDRPEGEPLPPYEPVYDPAEPESFVSFAIGVALGRFGAEGEGILDLGCEPHPPSPSPLGEGEQAGSLLGAGRKISPVMLDRARELRGRQTHAEEILWDKLRARRLADFKFRRQHPVGHYIVDFYCHEARLVVEVDGPSHSFADEYDQRRTETLESLGARIVRFKNSEVENDLDSVLTKIRELAEQSSSAPPLQKERGLGENSCEYAEGGEESAPRAQPRQPDEHVLPAGILFVTTESSDSLEHPACSLLHKAWNEHGTQVGSGDDLGTYLRTSFFVYHKKLYENRPIYFPLSSAKKSYVAYASIHRWKDDTLNVLLADHLVPEKRRLEGELEDIRKARTQAAGKGKAEKRFAEAQKLLEELTDFIDKVTAIAECGPPPPDDKTPKREVDARFTMDLDDGVMVNSAALWPLLEPQWKDPKKWWKELATAQGRKDYDWAHLAARYFPKRVREKCVTDPSLAVAHKCFWELHPAKAYAWELRLQDEIRAEFTIDEPESDKYRALFLKSQAKLAKEIEAAETKRRERKAAKAEEEENGPLFDQGDQDGEDADG